MLPAKQALDPKHFSISVHLRLIKHIKAFTVFQNASLDRIRQLHLFLNFKSFLKIILVKTTVALFCICHQMHQLMKDDRFTDRHVLELDRNSINRKPDPFTACKNPLFSGFLDPKKEIADLVLHVYRKNDRKLHTVDSIDPLRFRNQFIQIICKRAKHRISDFISVNVIDIRILTDSNRQKKNSILFLTSALKLLKKCIYVVTAGHRINMYNNSMIYHASGKQIRFPFLPSF